MKKDTNNPDQQEHEPVGSKTKSQSKGDPKHKKKDTSEKSATATESKPRDTINNADDRHAAGPIMSKENRTEQSKNTVTNKDTKVTNDDNDYQDIK